MGSFSKLAKETISLSPLASRVPARVGRLRAAGLRTKPRSNYQPGDDGEVE